MANVTIPKKIEQLFVNTLFEKELANKQDLEWNFSLSRKGKGTVKCLFVDTYDPIRCVHPINEAGKQFAPMITFNDSRFVRWVKSRGVFVDVHNRLTVFTLSDLGFEDIQEFMIAYDLEKENKINGFMLFVSDSSAFIQEPAPKPPVKQEELLGIALGRYHTAEELFERYKVVASVCNGFKGSKYVLSAKISKQLVKNRLYHRSGRKYSFEQVQKLRKSKYCKLLIDTPPVFITNEEEADKRTEYERIKRKMSRRYYYSDLEDIYTILSQNADLSPKEVANVLSSNGIMYKRDTPFISAIVANFREHGAYKAFLKERNSL